MAKSLFMHLECLVKWNIFSLFFSLFFLISFHLQPTEIQKIYSQATVISNFLSITLESVLKNK